MYDGIVCALYKDEPQQNTRVSKKNKSLSWER
jgi:hypothetical protein